MRIAVKILACTLVVSLSACSYIPKPSLPDFKWPRVHKVTVQQGNVITQKMVDRLTPGMTRSQVVYVMGEPVVKNPFNQNRWDYLYTIDVPGVVQSEQRISLFFEDDLLASFTGNLIPTDATTNDPVEEEDLIPDLEPEQESDG